MGAAYKRIPPCAIVCRGVYIFSSYYSVNEVYTIKWVYCKEAYDDPLSILRCLYTLIMYLNHQHCVISLMIFPQGLGVAAIVGEYTP